MFLKRVNAIWMIFDILQTAPVAFRCVLGLLFLLHYIPPLLLKTQNIILPILYHGNATLVRIAYNIFTCTKRIKER